MKSIDDWKTHSVLPKLTTIQKKFDNNGHWNITCNNDAKRASKCLETSTRPKSVTVLDNEFWTEEDLMNLLLTLKDVNCQLNYKRLCLSTTSDTAKDVIDKEFGIITNSSARYLIN